MIAKKFTVTLRLNNDNELTDKELESAIYDALSNEMVFEVNESAEVNWVLTAKISDE